MSKQIDMSDLIPCEIKDSTRRFIDTNYQQQSSMDELPPVRNRHEGYGLLAEAYQGVSGAVDNVKAAMRDCLRSLSGTDSNFQDAASNAFNSLLDTCIAAVSMGVQTLNVIYNIEGIRAAETTPLEELAAEAAEPEEEDDVPDVEEEE